MFDIGFWELVMVGVVALVVIGPKDLPRVARMAGLWLGRARRTLASVKDEIDREFKAQELQEMLTKQAQSRPLERFLEEPLEPARPAPRSAAPASQSGIGTDQGRHPSEPVEPSATKP